jgi:hypothetical protein
MFRRFPSILQPDKYGYTFDSGPMDYSSRHEVCRYFRQYETYGHGLVQHSHAWPITRTFMHDYLASLAAYLVANPEQPGDEETFTQTLAYEFSDGPSVDAMDFCASVVYRESDNKWTKRRYYSVQERKIGNKSKEHDKRYQEIKEWNDGRPMAIYRMLVGEWPTALKCYSYAKVIKDWTAKQPKMWMPVVPEFLEWKEFTGKYDSPETEKAEILDASYDLIKDVLERYRLSYQITQTMQRINRHVEELAPKPVLQIEGNTSAA